jgi:TRAP transporter TAXI family solute receptor
MGRLATVLIALSIPAACGSPPPAPPRQVVRLTRNTTIGEFLAREYAQAIPTVDFTLVDVVGSVAAVSAIQHGQADIGVAFADVAYEAHAGLADHADPSLAALRGVAALQMAPVHLLAWPGTPVRRVVDLRGHRIGTGQESSGQERLAELILRAYHLEDAAVARVSVVPDTAASSLSAGVVDAAFITGYYPVTSISEAARKGAYLIPIEGEPVDRLTREYPFLRPVFIPAHTYAGQAAAIPTIAVDRLLVCRSDLDDALVYALTRALFEVLPRLPAFQRTSLRLMDVQEASATPIPLHNGAARYYRERELTR